MQDILQQTRRKLFDLTQPLPLSVLIVKCSGAEHPTLPVLRLTNNHDQLLDDKRQ